MNFGRRDMPDIDIDVPYNRRDELYAAIGREWPGLVARISNHVKFHYKSALRAALAEHAPKVMYRKGMSLSNLPLDPDIAARVAADVSEKVGSVRTESLHCGGIVIFDREGHIPRELILKEVAGKLPQIKLDKDETEDAGYIKIDVLSNRGLAQWWSACSGSGKKTLLDYPARDDGIARLFASGRTLGLTFAESRGCAHIFQQMMPNCVDDIAVALALIRPAAAAGGRKAEYLAAFRAGVLPSNDLEKPIVYDDDALIRIRAALAPVGFEKDMLDSFADGFRRAFAKQWNGEIMRFRTLCRAQHHPEGVISRMVDDLNQLQHYSFCKSHALSYAQLVWALAYEKVHHPHAFWAATLNHCHSEYRRWVHWREARCSGLLLPRGPPPYILGTKHGLPALLSQKGEQLLLCRDDNPVQQLRDIKTLGYWISESFFPGCYRRVRRIAQRKFKKNSIALDEPEYAVDFCGLVATGRVVYKDTDGDESSGASYSVTFITIGYENGKYMDLVIQGAKGYLLGFAAVAGTARTRRPDSNGSLDVKTIRGIPLKDLLEVRSSSS